MTMFILTGLLWFAVIGIVLLFKGWLWIGLIMLITPIVLVWFIWNASL